MVDQLYHGLLAGIDDYGQLWSIVKMVLLVTWLWMTKFRA